MTSLSLEDRVKRLEDIEEINALMVRYASSVNKGWNNEEVDVSAMPSVYTEDATWDSEELGVHGKGLDVIMEGLPASTDMVEFSMHTFLNPQITLDGDSATGKWLMWIASKIDNDPRAVYMSSDMGYRRTPAGWRISSVVMHFGMLLHNE
jgi:ketosteroid isomerase-like protein